jgi:hypothetical protein
MSTPTVLQFHHPLATLLFNADPCQGPGRGRGGGVGSVPGTWYQVPGTQQHRCPYAWATHIFPMPCVPCYASGALQHAPRARSPGFPCSGQRPVEVPPVPAHCALQKCRGIDVHMQIHVYIYIYIYLKASPLPPAPVLAAGCWMLTGWLAGWWLAGSWRAGCFRAPPGSWDHWGWVVTPRFPGHTPQCQMEDPGYRIRPAACRIQE